MTQEPRKPRPRRRKPTMEVLSDNAKANAKMVNEVINNPGTKAFLDQQAASAKMVNEVINNPAAKGFLDQQMASAKFVNEVINNPATKGFLDQQKASAKMLDGLNLRDFTKARENYAAAIDLATSSNARLAAPPQLPVDRSIAAVKLGPSTQQVLREEIGELRTIMQASGEQIEALARTGAATLDILTEGARAAERSSGRLSRLTVVLIVLTIVLALPVAAALWHDWAVPAFEWARRFVTGS